MLFTMQIDEDFSKMLDRLAKNQERSKAAVVRYLVKREAEKLSKELLPKYEGVQRKPANV